MEYNNENLLELLDYIDPALLDYTEWTGIGMALKDAGVQGFGLGCLEPPRFKAVSSGRM